MFAHAFSQHSQAHVPGGIYTEYLGTALIGSDKDYTINPPMGRGMCFVVSVGTQAGGHDGSLTPCEHALTGATEVTEAAISITESPNNSCLATITAFRINEAGSQTLTVSNYGTKDYDTYTQIFYVRDSIIAWYGIDLDISNWIVGTGLGNYVIFEDEVTADGGFVFIAGVDSASSPSTVSGDSGLVQLTDLTGTRRSAAWGIVEEGQANHTFDFSGDTDACVGFYCPRNVAHPNTWGTP